MTDRELMQQAREALEVLEVLQVAEAEAGLAP